jgi:Lon protease-like protein
MVLPLQIFEPRYREMISDCVKANAPFGVVLIQEGMEVGGPAKPYTVGTLAKISEVVKLDDGRLLITTVGTERFRLLKFRNEKTYMTGDIETWPEEESGSSVDFNLIQQVQAAFTTYLGVLSELARKRIEGLEMPTDAASLSYVIPNWLLQIEMLEKQQLLELANPFERLQEEDRLLRRETEFLRRIKAQAEQQGVVNDNDTPPSSNHPSYTPNFPFSRN